MKTILTTGAIMIAVAIGWGALGAHVLSGKLTERLADAYDTASLYLLTQSIGVLVLSCLPLADKIKSRLGKLLIAGALLFSGSIYILCFSDLLDLPPVVSKIAGPVTPIGGLLLIVTWLLVALNLIRTKSNEL